MTGTVYRKAIRLWEWQYGENRNFTHLCCTPIVAGFTLDLYLAICHGNTNFKVYKYCSQLLKHENNFQFFLLFLLFFILCKSDYEKVKQNMIIIILLSVCSTEWSCFLFTLPQHNFFFRRFSLHISFFHKINENFERSFP